MGVEYTRTWVWLACWACILFLPTEPNLGKPLSRSTIPEVVPTLLSTPAVIPVCWVISAPSGML